MSLLLVSVGTALGASTRWLVSQTWRRRFASEAHWMTISVNVLGSFVLGCLAGRLSIGESPMLLFGVGFCGGLTTFSAFAWQTHRLAETGSSALALLNVGMSLVGCFLAAMLGFSFLR